MYVLLLLFTRFTRGTVRPLFAYTFPAQAICGDTEEKARKDPHCQLHAQSQTVHYAREVYIHLHTRLNHLYYHWPLERKAVRESLRRQRRKKVGSRLFFPLPYTSQTFSNVLLMAAVEVWLTKEGKHWKHSAEKQWHRECEEKGRGSDREKKKYIFCFYLMVTLQRQVSGV